MTSSSQPGAEVRFSIMIFLVAVFVLGSLLQANAQTFQVLYNFTGGRDGAGPLDGLTMDRNGNLYGTTVKGGTYGYGVIWEITS